MFWQKFNLGFKLQVENKDEITAPVFGGARCSWTEELSGCGGAREFSVIYHRVCAGLQLKNCQKEILMQTQMLHLNKIHAHGHF